MTKFQPGDAVFVLGADENRMRQVSWTHTDGDVTVEYFPINGGEPAKVSSSSVVYADPALQYFAWGHLPERLQAVSRSFGKLANDMVMTLPRCTQRDVFLQKLLESKDAAVRARLS